MPDPDAVARALTTLAHPDDGQTRQSYDRTIADASDAFADVADAVAFLDDGGEVTLRRAVGAATRDGHHCADEGRRLLCDLERLRASLACSASPGVPEDDHFHSPRTTVFSGGGESPDR